MELVKINELDSDYINKIFDEIKTKIQKILQNSRFYSKIKVRKFLLEE